MKKTGGGSYSAYKDQVADFIKHKLIKGSKILDMGCGGGIYGKLLFGNGYYIVGVDSWQDAIDICIASDNYDELITQDIRKFDYEDKTYDLIIFGDVLEHLTVKDAKAVLEEAKKHTSYLLVAVPYLYEQGELYGNPAEKHLQPDLTDEKFNKRYPGFDRIFGNDKYGYYWKELNPISHTKICIYAICKNEIKFVDQWLDNVSEADYIVVLDTGSTDGTYEKLKADPRVTKVEQKIIDPWRFDVARNESLKLCPEDTDVYFCTDFDELLDPGWAQNIRNHWEIGKTNRGLYTYAWGHTAIGEPTDIFKYDKMHSKGYHWKFPVHEVLWPDDENLVEERLDFGDAIYLNHYPDKTKERHYYFDLLKLAVEENPDDSHEQMMLAREYYLNGDVDTAIEEFLKVLNMPDVDAPNKREVLLNSLLQLAIMYKEKEMYDESLWYCQEFIKEDYTYREPYLIMASVFSIMKMPTLSEACCKAAEEYSYQHFSWVERKTTFTNWLEDERSIAEYNLGKYDEAIKDGKAALEHDPDNSRLLKNYTNYLQAKITQLEEKLKS